MLWSVNAASRTSDARVREVRTMRLGRGVMVVPSVTAMVGLLGLSVLAADGCGGNSKAPTEDLPSVTSSAKACKKDDTCKSGQNRCSQDLGICVACEDSGDCGENQVCIDTECVAADSCEGSDQCADESKPICDSGHCVECAEHSDCKGSERCENNRCRAACARDDECSDVHTYCEQGACMPCWCPGDTSKCLDDKTLAVCATNGSHYVFTSCTTTCISKNKGTDEESGSCEGDTTKPPSDAGAGGSTGAGGATGQGGSSSVGGSTGTGGSAAGGASGQGGSSAPAEAGVGGSSGEVKDAAPEAAPTCAPTDVLPGGEPCTTIPAFRGNQVVDGKPDEFCSIPAKTLTTQTAAFVNPSGATDATSQATIRVGWSASALHVFVHVASAKVFQSSGELYDGDNVQLFIAGSKPANGTVDGTANGSANQLFVAPPSTASGTAKAKAASGTPKYEYAARISDGGYDVEIKWPWPSNMTAGKQIGFDMMIGVSNPDAGGRKLEYLLYRGTVTGSCSEAYCDATLWCTPTLQ